MISEAHSAAILGASHASNAYSLISDVDSQVLLNASMISDIQSQIDSGVTIGVSSISDIGSRVWAAKYTGNSAASSFGSMMSDIQSAVALRASSDYLSQVHSDLRSQISGITASVSASDISDIASAVWAGDYSDLGVAASTFGSLIRAMSSGIDDTKGRTSDLLSDTSDIISMLSNLSDLISDAHSAAILGASHASDAHSAALLNASSDYMSQVHSDLRSQISGITASVSASDISDIASAVWTEKYTAHSAASSFGSFSRAVPPGSAQLRAGETVAPDGASRHHPEVHRYQGDGCDQPHHEDRPARPTSPCSGRRCRSA